MVALVAFEALGAVDWGDAELLVGASLSLAVCLTYLGELGRDAWFFRLKLWRHRWPDLLFAVPAGLALGGGSLRGAATLLGIRLITRELIDLVAWRPVAPVLQALLSRPLTLLVLSFLLPIAAGTVALMFPAATQSGEGTPLMTAFFTATSATTVGGMSVVDVGSYFSRFGLWVILILVQVGGLGIMTITTTLALAFRSRLSARARGAMQEILEEETVVGFRRMLFSIVFLTVTIEALGALALWPSLTHDASGEPLVAKDRAFYAAFHSVSSFCNAGFALYPDSLARFVASPGVNLSVMVLIILGGLGFPVLNALLDVRLWWKRGLRRGWQFLEVHARLVLVSSAALILFGAVTWFAFEQGHTLAGLSWLERLWASLFMSVSLRTAGFGTVDVALLSTPMLLLSLVIMFIGGSSGGTAGGVKTTTIAVLALTFRAILRRRPEVEVYGRTIPANTVYRASAVALVSFGLLFVLTLLLFMAEPNLPFRDVLFEAVSAFGTTGATTGLTSQTSAAGRFVLCLLMFVGRLGPFTLALAVGLSPNKGSFGYPTTKVVVG
ncbi:MAG: potassium transporter TrkG [Myxococcaceae bacterium]